MPVQRRAGAFLTPVEEESLLAHLAAHGHTYSRYLEWAELRKKPETKRFTELYFGKWRAEHKAEYARAQFRHEVALLDRASIMNRPSRITSLETLLASTFRMINSEGEMRVNQKGESMEIHEKTVDSFVKLADMARKLLVEIRVERGEHDPKRDEDELGTFKDDIAESANTKATKAMLEHFKSRP